MTVRKAVPADLPRLLAIYAYAREFMRQTGNPNQWKQTHPLPSIVEDDIRQGLSFVIEDKGEIHGVFYFRVGADPTYAEIRGAWPDNEPYGVIHRIAGDGRVKGVLQTAVDFGLSQIDEIRIDTHADNRVMQGALAKAGFSRCGLIRLANGEDRIAFAKRK